MGSVVLGPAAGGAAYGPALTDVVIIGPAGRVFVTGPDVVRSVTGENVDMESLGGPSRTRGARKHPALKKKVARTPLPRRRPDDQTSPYDGKALAPGSS